MIAKAIKAGFQAARSQIDSRYESTRRRARDRHYIEWRRNLHGAPAGRAPTIADRPNIFAVLIEAWRFRSKQGKRAAYLEQSIRSLVSSWSWHKAKLDLAAGASRDYQAGFDAAVEHIRDQLAAILAIDKPSP